MTEEAKRRMRDDALEWLKSTDSKDINYELIGYLVTGNPTEILQWMVSERENFLIEYGYKNNHSHD